MNCRHVQDLLNAWIDDELSEADRITVDAHLVTCADCRAAAEALQQQHALLRSAFEPQRARAGQLARRVMQELSAPTLKMPAAAETLRPRHWLSLLLATAVGFLAAVVIFQPWKLRERTVIQQVVVDAPAPADVVANPIAQLIVATGDVEYTGSADKQWQPVSDAANFKCSSDASIRTKDDVRCELVTTDGCVIRLNGQTEITLRSPRAIELERGQIWCRSPENIPLEVQPTAGSAWSCKALTPSSFQAAIQADGKVQITAAGGNVAVTTPQDSRQLKPNETATIADNRVERQSAVNDLATTRWMNPLLMKKGHADAELSSRVDEMLARIGSSKLSYLYEDEIRSLGEYCVLPLLRFVQSPQSQPEPSRRLTAVKIVSDLAPHWAIGDLVGLLQDSNAEVRYQAARALERLTGSGQGCPLEEWRAQGPHTAQALASWQQWWKDNAARYPSPGPPMPAQPISKARAAPH